MDSNLTQQLQNLFQQLQACSSTEVDKETSLTQKILELLPQSDEKTLESMFDHNAYPKAEALVIAKGYVSANYMLGRCLRAEGSPLMFAACGSGKLNAEQLMQVYGHAFENKNPFLSAIGGRIIMSNLISVDQIKKIYNDNPSEIVKGAALKAGLTESDLTSAGK